jgi:hypothetical protein
VSDESRPEGRTWVIDELIVYVIDWVYHMLLLRIRQQLPLNEV